MRVGIIAVHHESNTFLPSPTTINQFRADTLLTGEPIRQQFAAAHHEIGGFFAGLAEEKLDAVPIFAARAIPSGVITAETASALVDRLLDELDRHLPFDGLLIAAHGAAVSEIERDFDGFWLSRLRHHVGANGPIVCTLDLHANLSQRMVKACDAMIAYRTNPHLDQRERGIEAAHLIARTLRGEVKPNQAAAFPPVAINIERQSTDTSPCLELIALADEMRRRPGVLSISAILGFPYADVIEMGSSFVAVTDNDPLLAQSLADELAAYVIHRRESFDAQFISIDQALHDASHSPGPVCLLDIGDNVGGGSPGDGTALAHAIRSRGKHRAFVCINDPQSANDARSAGAGAIAHLSIGGKIDTAQGPPLDADFRIRSIHDGQFHESQPRHGGKTRYDMGPCAVVEIDAGLTILLTSRRTPPFSLGMLTSCGLDPADFHLIVAKGVHAPLAAYKPVCRTFIRVNTPGLTTADMRSLAYGHRRHPLYPLDPI